MIQYSKERDARLNALERQLKEVCEERERLDNKYDLLFKQVFQEFDKQLGEGVPASFICEDGFKLGRIVPQMRPVVDSNQAEAIILEFFDEKTWNRSSDAIRVVNQDKLAKEIRKQPALGAMLNEKGVITVPTRAPSRIRTDKLNKQEQIRYDHMTSGESEEAVG